MIRKLIAPSSRKERRHPKSWMNRLKRGGKTAIPIAGPAAMTPDISDRFFTNQRVTTDMTGAQAPLMPIPVKTP